MCHLTRKGDLPLQVGSYLKDPRFPIWVVCSESHFSVLFSECEDVLTAGRRSAPHFDLHYYDGLANQQEPIRLTVCECKRELNTHHQPL